MAKYIRRYASGDPFAPYDDGEPTRTAHLLRHGVDIGEAIKLGAVKWRASGSSRDLASPSVALAWADRYLGMSDGMFMADEEVGGSHTPSRGTETCSVVETMFSLRVAYEAGANVSFFDRLERLAFNALPAALWPDVTANAYHHSSNQVETAQGQWAYDLFYCCTANVHQGWPKFIAAQVHLLEDSDEEVVVVSGYAPSSRVTPTGTLVRVSGAYPFADEVLVTVSRATRLRLRVPCWTELMRITTFDATGSQFGVRTDEAPCRFADLALVKGGSARLEFVQDIKVFEWAADSGLDGQSAINAGAIEVHRGPLTFALRPATNVTATPIAGAPAHIKRREAHHPLQNTRTARRKENMVFFDNRDLLRKIPAAQVAATEAWNYALLRSSLTFDAPSDRALGAVPFNAETPAVVRVLAKGRLVPAWTSAGGARGVAPPPASPLESDAPLVDLELVPFGATNVRIAVFPQLKE